MRLIFSIFFFDDNFLLVKIILVTCYSTILISTTKYEDLAFAISKLLKPLRLFGVENKKIAMQILLSIRFIPVILSEAKNIKKSMQMKGISFEYGKLKDKLYALNIFLTSLFNMSLNKADNVYETLQFRGYNQFIFKEKKYSIKILEILVFFSHILLIILVGANI